MALNSLPEIYHSSWVEMRSGIAMRYELDHESRSVTLYFGHHDDYVIALTGDSLDRLVELGTAARRELTARPDGRVTSVRRP